MGARAGDEPRATAQSQATDTTTADRDKAPTIEQRQLGAHLRALRERGQLATEDAAKELVWPATRIWELEAGIRRPNADDLRELSALYRLSNAEAKQLAELTDRAKHPGWWADYQDLGVPYVGLEQHATAITTYTTQYFPALIQTVDYARTVISSIAPRMEPRILRERVEARMRRQHVLTQERPPRYQVLLDESALQRPVGGRTVMREQLNNVLRMSADRKATVQIVPLDIGAHPVQDSNFVLLDFKEGEHSSVVFVEGLVKSMLLEKKEDLNRYREALGYLLDLALSPPDSIALISAARDRYSADD
jgi:hypothetical protein